MYNPVADSSLKHTMIRKLIMIPSAGIVLLAVMFGVNYAFKYIAGKAEQKRAMILTNATNNASQAVRTLVTEFNAKLAMLSKDKTLIELFKAGDLSALNAATERYETDIKSVLKLRFILPNSYRIDYDNKLPFGYASIVLVRQAEKGQAIAEIHGVSVDKPYFVLARRVVSTDGKVIGIIHLSLPFELVRQVFTGLNIPAVYIELQQGLTKNPVVLAKYGEAKLQQGDNLRTKLAGTSWYISCWDGMTSRASSDNLQTGFNKAWLLMVVLLLVGLGIFRRRRRRFGYKS